MSSAERTPGSAAETVAWLCGHGDRRTGTDAERRAANGLAERLRAGGRRVAIEPIYVQPQWQLVLLAHCAIAIAGSLLAAVEPAVGFALVLVAATSLYLDLTGRRYLLRRLFFRRASQNVVSPPVAAGERPRLVLCAGYDAGLTGAAYNRWATGGFARLQRLWPGAASPSGVIFWATALLLPALGLRLAGVEAGWVAALQLPQTLVLVIAAFMLGEIGLSRTSPGAAHNGSGIAAALAAVEALDEEPPEALDVTVLFCAAGESGRQGLSSFLRAHRRELPRERTWFIDLASAGHGSARYVGTETPVLAQPLDPGLIELADALCLDSDDRSRLDLGPAGSASMAAGFGYPAITLTSRRAAELFPDRRHSSADLPGAVDPGAIASVSAFAVDLVRLLDRQVEREDRATTRG